MTAVEVPVDAVVRLSEDVPALHLQHGNQGIVVSIWLSPGTPLYEVEFPQPGRSAPLRTLLRTRQLEVVAAYPGGAS